MVLGLGTAVFAYAHESTGLVSGVTIAGVDVGGLDGMAALKKVETAWEQIQAGDMKFTISDKTLTYQVVTAGPDDTILEYATFDPVASVNEAIHFGHRGNIWQQIRERVSGWVGRPHAFGHVTVATEDIQKLLADDTATFVTQPTDAAINIASDDTITINTEVDWKNPDIASAAKSMSRHIQALTLPTVAVPVKAVAPTFPKSANLESIATSSVPSILDRAPITLTLDAKTWTITKASLRGLLGFRAGTNGTPQVGFDTKKTGAYLEKLRGDIDTKAQEARFTITDGRVQAFSTSQVGRSLDISETIRRLNTLLDGTEKSVAVAVKETRPISEGVANNNLGITELVAEGKTNFRGSPTNRKYNLSYGAKLLNGLLIQPGETFSLVTALGKIDGAHGWKPELVIKGSKITPEFGGGLCQVATTLFRAALNAGLPIVERMNHSLRISYYEPPVGLDATIYEPKPDLRFRNDYDGPLLLQTEVSGTYLIFRLYGTKDGRTVTLPTPKVFNRVAIPKTTTVETSDLKPGQKQCQTPGHPGADAIATYTVTKADGTSKTQTFTSHYRAIGVICRVGKKAAPKPAATNTNSSANVNAPTNTNSSAPANTNSAADANTNTAP